MPKMTYREAITKALADELRSDENVVFFRRGRGSRRWRV